MGHMTKFVVVLQKGMLKWLYFAIDIVLMMV
jgi:hypothetical protein